MAEKLDKEIFDDIHQALVRNGLNGSVSSFIADLTMRVRLLEQKLREMRNGDKEETG